jgi:hypothetical protein
VLTSIVDKTAIVVSANGVEGLHLDDDILVEGNHIAGFNISRFILLEQNKGIAGVKQVLEDGLLVGIEGDGNCGGVHCRKI